MPLPLCECIKGLPQEDKLDAIYCALLAISESSAGAISQIDTGDTLWVDAVFGDDATAQRQRQDLPFLTTEAARDAATTGDTIYVRPGSYTVTSSLAKNGVNWNFQPGASVTRSDYTQTGIWDDGGAAMSFVVAGSGDFVRTNDGQSDEDLILSVVNVENASSVIHITCNSIYLDDQLEESEGHAVNVLNGELHLRAVTITGIGNISAGVFVACWWENGAMFIDADRISGLIYGVYTNVDVAPTGDMYIRADEIEAVLGNALYFDGSDTTAASWVDALVVRSGSQSIVAPSGSGMRWYVRSQKLFGRMVLDGGLGYLEADKLSAVANGGTNTPSLLYASNAGANARLAVKHWDVGAFTGESVKVTNGTVQFLGGDFVGGASSNGMEISGGTVRVQGMRIDTSANSGSNPVTKTGGTLKMYQCTLVSQGARDAIEGGVAQTVSLMGCFSNNALDAQVTNDITGGLITDAQVS